MTHDDDGSFRIGVIADAGGSLHVRLAGELDLAASQSLHPVIAALAGKADAHLHVDSLTFIDCAGLRTLLELTRSGQAGQAPVFLDSRLGPSVSRLVRLTAVEPLLRAMCV